MANYLAVATVTATLQRTLQAAVQSDIEGARITTVRPNDIGNGTPESGVNLFLYQVITNPALNNMDATPFRSRGTPTKRQAAVDLYYMFSFYGNEADLEPQRLLGSVMRTLNDQRVIDQETIHELTTFNSNRVEIATIPVNFTIVCVEARQCKQIFIETTVTTN